MSFAFDFADEDLEDVLGSSAGEQPTKKAPAVVDGKPKSEKAKGKLPCVELPISTKIQGLPPRISFSSLAVPLRRSSVFRADRSAPGESSPSVLVPRRDLFDARFQVLQAVLDQEDAAGDADSAEGAGQGRGTEPVHEVNSDTDLIPQVYEGGLKTWECSLDLVSTLRDRYGDDAANLRGKRILDLGCGTAIPTAYLLRRLFDQPASAQQVVRTELHLLDFNEHVLKLVSLPNLVLAWYFSKAAVSARAQHPIIRPKAKKGLLPPSEDQPEEATPGEIELTPELREAFLKALDEHAIDLRLFAGDWGSFSSAPSGTPASPYDLIITSETIYSLDSLPSLVEVLRSNSAPGKPNALEGLSATLQNGASLSESQKQVQKSSDPDAAKSGAAEGQASGTVCLVAAKILYFGVGGGVQAFKQAVAAQQHGWVEEVDRFSSGVGRIVLQVGWAP